MPNATLTDYVFRSEAGEDIIRRRFGDVAHAELWALGWNAAIDRSQKGRLSRQLMISVILPIAGGVPVYVAR